MKSKRKFPDSFNSVSTHVATPIKQSATEKTCVEENIRITKKFYDTFIRDSTDDTSLVYLKL